MIIAALAAASVMPGAEHPFWDLPTGVNAIEIHQRFSAPVCAGVCGDSNLLIRTDGLVTYDRRTVTGRHWKRFSYRVSSAQVSEFWKLYETIRPAGMSGPRGACDATTLIIDWDIWWSGPNKRSRLLACWSANDVRNAWFRSFAILRFSPVTGQRFTAKQSQIFDIKP